MLRLEMVESGSGNEMFLAEVRDFGAAEALIQFYDSAFEGIATRANRWGSFCLECGAYNCNRELLPLPARPVFLNNEVLSRWEGCDVYAVDTDGKRYLYTESDWEQL